MQSGVQAEGGSGQGGLITEEAKQSYKELFSNPDNEWNAESDSKAGERGYLADMDNPDTNHLISGDGFSLDDVDNWNEK